MDTIYAVATASGPAGVAIVRVSGPDALRAAARLTPGRLHPRKAVLRRLRGADGEPIDEGIVLHFPAGNSFTGEDIVEFQVHGSLAVTAALLEELASEEGCRPAEAGEFTRRALMNNRMDLTQVEGLADLINAETELQRRQALQMSSGRLTRICAEWRNELTTCMALLTATIDFSDEDVPEDVSSDILGRIERMIWQIRELTDGAETGERIRDGFTVAIIGPPNSGKSTLMNYIVGRDVAITSDIAGTTRDTIEVRLDLKGIPVTLVDTAGLRNGGDEVERLGIERARVVEAKADLVIELVESDDDACVDARRIKVGAKSDTFTYPFVSVSGRTGDGVPELLDSIYERLKGKVRGNTLLGRHRQARALAAAVDCLSRASCSLQGSAHNSDLVFDGLEGAVRSLDALTGKIDVEDVLAQVFSSFCIGK